MAAKATDHRHQEKSRAWRPPRRRLESRLRGLCDRDDGPVHRVVAAEQQQTGSGSGGRIFQGSHRQHRRKVGSDMQGAGESFSVSKDNMAQLKEELQKTMRQVPNFDKLKNHIDMTITSEGLRIELLESATSTFFDSGNAGPEHGWPGHSAGLSKELGDSPEQNRRGRTHGFQTVFGEEQLFKLGALRGPRERGRQTDAAKWHSCGSDYAGPRLCRPASPQSGRAARPVEPSGLADRAVFE